MDYGKHKQITQTNTDAAIRFKHKGIKAKVREDFSRIFPDSGSN